MPLRKISLEHQKTKADTVQLFGEKGKGMLVLGEVYVLLPDICKDYV